jgi:hypothetical protein
VPHRAHGVDHIPGRKPAGGGLHRFTGRKAVRESLPTDHPACLQDVWTASPVDRPIHASPAKQARIGRVDDDVHSLSGDVARLHEQASAQEMIRAFGSMRIRPFGSMHIAHSSLLISPII